LSARALQSVERVPEGRARVCTRAKQQLRAKPCRTTAPSLAHCRLSALVCASQHRDKRSRVSSSFVLNPMDEAMQRKVRARHGLSELQPLRATTMPARRSPPSQPILELTPPPLVLPHFRARSATRW